MIMQKQYESNNYIINYTGQLSNGKTLRSSTMFIKDGGKLVGLLCVNFDDSRFHEVSDTILRLVHRTTLSTATTSQTTRPPSSPPRRSMPPRSRRSISSPT